MSSFAAPVSGLLQLLCALLTVLSPPKNGGYVHAFSIQHMPEISPATGLPNRVYEWREGQKIRYQATEEPTKKNAHSKRRPIVLVHGLFVNSDHWRRTLLEFNNDERFKVFALDLLGYGYSDKPPVGSEIAHKINGENTVGRFDDELLEASSVLKDVELGSANGVERRIRDIELRHPISGSPYNFYTWSELITDFCRDVVLRDDSCDDAETVTLVCNSIGTTSALQAVIDTPDLYNGVFSVSPNFRELHSAEVAFSSLSMPIIRRVQRLLREKGRPLFDALAKPDTVKQILLEPYKVRDAVDDILVKVLLDPLLCDGACDVVFDTLSYSAGPLPEQQLSMFPPDKPVWIGYGLKDPWTPNQRVEALTRFSAVEKVMGWDGIGHCPHDEAPELVHPIMHKFLERIENINSSCVVRKAGGGDETAIPFDGTVTEAAETTAPKR